MRWRAATAAFLLLAAVGASAPSTPSDPLLDPKVREEMLRTGKYPRPPTIEELGLTTPFVAVDRFSDAAGTLLRRSLDPSLPKPNEPFSLDDPRFALTVKNPLGQTAHCYDLDVRPSKPNRYYVFYDSLNNYRLGQLPVIDVIPGDPGYSDLWDIWKVVTPDSFRETNWVRDAATVEKLISDPSSGYTAHSTGVYLNAPIVPKGTTADSKGEGKPGRAGMGQAWYRGKRAAFLYLEGKYRLAANGTVPVGRLTAPGGGGWPPRLLTTTTWPNAPGYTPLVAIVDGAGHPETPGPVNCPIVGTASP